MCLPIFPPCFTTYNQVAATIVRSSQEMECWLCMDNIRGEKTSIMCKCPDRYCHKTCMAKWQLQCLGKPEEKYCRFCYTMLPDWRECYPIVRRHKYFTPDLIIKIVVQDSHVVLRLKSDASNYIEKFTEALKSQLGVDIASDHTIIQLSTLVDGIEVVSTNKDTLNSILYLAAYNAQHRFNYSYQVTVQS
jgi:hypothetical protein